MKKLAVIFCLLFFATGLSAQKHMRSLPFILQVDGDFPDASVIKGVFQIIDSIKNVKDSIMFDFHIGRLMMTEADYKRFINFNQKDQLVLKIGKLGADDYTWNWYEIPIPTKYINAEYPVGFINEEYFIVKIYNKADEESNLNYVFPKGKEYVSQLVIPGMRTIIARKNRIKKRSFNEQK